MADTPNPRIAPHPTLPGFQSVVCVGCSNHSTPIRLRRGDFGLNPDVPAVLVAILVQLDVLQENLTTLASQSPLALTA